MRIIEFFKNIGRKIRNASTEKNQKKNGNSRLRFRRSKKLKRKIQFVKAFPLLGLADIPSIQTELKDGNIVILNISQFLEKQKNKFRELKRAVDQLSYISKTHEGEIAQLGDNYILMTPSPSIKIWKEKLQISL